jgi:hypothetical protein
MIEYAILIVMVTFAIGFAWLWFIEQKKKRWAVPIATPLVSTSNARRYQMFCEACGQGLNVTAESVFRAAHCQGARVT